MKVHPTITAGRVESAVREQLFGLENPGFCIACGADHDSCEPDAEKYECYDCGRRTVFGASWILEAGAYHDY